MWFLINIIFKFLIYNTMKTLSVCFIVKNEEEVIERILSQVLTFADEIIVVDTGSNDKTCEIAKKYTNNIYSFKWVNDFSKARNFAFEKATCNYLMWLDADDFIDNLSIKKLIKLKSNLNLQDVIMLPYEIAFDENGNSTFSYFRERIVKNNGKFKFVEPIHEVIVPSGNIEYKNIPIKHKKIKATDPKRNLNLFLELKNKNYSFSPRLQFYYACELYYNALYDDAITEFNKFLKMNGGYIENKIQAVLNMCRIFVLKQNYALALSTAFSSFAYSLPRAEILCEIGYIYLCNKMYKEAIYWYKLAIQKYNLKSGAFVETDYYNFIPYVQIGLCYYYLKDYKKAYKYNAKALKIKPNNSIAINNNNEYLKLINKSISTKFL